MSRQMIILLNAVASIAAVPSILPAISYQEAEQVQKVRLSFSNYWPRFLTH
jgi:hypothetical protein